MTSVRNIVKKRVEILWFPIKQMSRSYLLESASFIWGPDLKPLRREMTVRTGQGSQLLLQGRMQRSPNVFLFHFQSMSPPVHFSPSPFLPQVHVHVPPQTEGTVVPHVMLGQHRCCLLPQPSARSCRITLQKHILDCADLYEALCQRNSR